MTREKKSKSSKALTALYKISILVCSAVNAIANLVEYFG